ncbi:MAG: AAA family ATPase [Candidatus Micrarchaeota archaeon]|nr:AAA family ATPase [Candidatus Micrarchaeota archaeon]
MIKVIKSIELVNWKTHGSTRLNFARGTNLLIGQMGAGKSSIMDAISFALFGTFPSMSRGSVGGLIRNKPSQKREAKIRLEFTNGDDEYAVERRLTLDGPSSAELKRNGSYLQSQPKRVTEEIERILRIDYDLFSKAIYAEQNGLDYFLNIDPRERKRKIDGFLGLDRFVNALENTKATMNDLNRTASSDEQIAEGFDVKQLNEQLGAIAAELEGYRKTNSEAKERKKDVEKEKDAVERELKASKEMYDKRMKLDKQIQEMGGRLSALKHEIGEIKKKGLMGKEELDAGIRKAEKQLKALVDDEKEMGERLLSAQGVKAKLEGDLARARKDLSEMERLKKEIHGKDIDEFRKRHEALAKEIEEAVKESASSMAMKEEKERALAELKKHISKCPVCERDLDEGLKQKLTQKNMKEIASMRKRIDELKSMDGSKRKERDSISEQLKKMEISSDKLKDYEGIEGRLKEIEGSITKSAKDSESAKSGHEAAKERVLKARDSIASLRSSRETVERGEAYAAEAKRIDKEISDRRAEQQGIDVSQERLDALQADFSDRSSMLSKINAEIESNSRYMSDKEKQIEGKRVEIAKVERIYETIKKKKRIVEELAKFRSSLEETQVVLRSRLVGSVNEIMHEIWPQIYPYGDYTSIMLDATDNDYVLKLRSVVDNEEIWQEVEAIASGGERSTACLTMRIAIALVLVPNLKWLILDEPTHNIDREGIAKFVEVLNDAIPKIIDQTFIITHDEALKQVSNAKIYMLNRNKDEHQETGVIEL